MLPPYLLMKNSSLGVVGVTFWWTLELEANTQVCSEGHESPKGYWENSTANANEVHHKSLLCLGWGRGGEGKGKCFAKDQGCYWRNPEPLPLCSQQFMPQKADSGRALGWGISIFTSPFSQWMT